MRFRTSEEVAPALEAVGAEVIGDSEEGRPILGAVVGSGGQNVSLVAGAHSDEPVGPETLRGFLLDERWRRYPEFRFVVVPHVNPDGEARNRAWTERWPDPEAYLEQVFREPPGRDVEFGYPEMRAENRAAAAFLERNGPFALHMSLHGMAAAEGALLLIERHWIERTEDLRAAFRRAAAGAGLGLHDHDRGGDKGFLYLGPGFWSTPEGRAMRRHFEESGDPETAAKFHLSSMEYVRSLGGDPLCLVTELPLFVLDNPDPQPGVPAAWLAWRETRDPSVMRPLDLEAAVALQLRTLELGLTAIGAGHG